MSDRHDLRRQTREIREALSRFEPEQLIDILTHIFRQYVMEVSFHPEAVPRYFQAISEPNQGTGGATIQLAVDDRRAVRAVWLDQPAGAYRISWEWDR